MTIEELLKEPEWKIALGLNRVASDAASRITMREEFDKNHAVLKEKLGDERFGKLAGIVSYANSMMLDFESALKYSLIENDEQSLLQLQDNAMLYGRSEVVSALDRHGRENLIDSIIINSHDYQNFLVCHALPLFRLYRTGEAEAYSIDMEIYKKMILEIEMDEKQALKNAITLLERTNNDNTARKLLFSRLLGDKKLIKEYNKELKTKLSIPRQNIDQAVLERATLMDLGTIRKLQSGDCNKLFPLASNIYLLQSKEKKVWKENLKLYTDFSRLDGYNQEKDILTDLDHPNIVKLLGTFEEKGMEFLELEYAPGKSLDKQPKLDEKEVLQIGITLCDTLEYLHSKNVAYMDLKDTNIMYDQRAVEKDGKVKDHLKLLDFGMSQKTDGLDDSTVLTTLLSTPKYLTPEQTGFRAYKSTDTFQLGILLYELLYQKHPFFPDEFGFKKGDDNRESEIIAYGLSVRYGEYKKTKDQYEELFSKMFEKDPVQRSSLSSVRQTLQARYNLIAPPKEEMEKTHDKNAVEKVKDMIKKEHETSPEVIIWKQRNAAYTSGGSKSYTTDIWR